MENDQNTMQGWLVTPDPKQHEFMIGIDFGHGETSAASCVIGWELSPGQLPSPEDIEMGNNKKVIPSAINIQPNGQIFIGSDAFKATRLRKADVEICFKQQPKDINGIKEQLMIQFMHHVYLRIRESVGSKLTDTNHLVYIAIPSGWDNQAKDLYGQMACQAGLPIVGITTESRAAFIHVQHDLQNGLPKEANQGSIIFDMGSSTLDFTYIDESGKPLDHGYNCGASQVEKILYEDKRNEIREFEDCYPNLVPALLYKIRDIKEQYYSDTEDGMYRIIHLDDALNVDMRGTIKLSYSKDELKDFLERTGYIDQIRQAMLDFKNKHIPNKPLLYVVKTGGASRMDFIDELIQECWNLPKERIYKCDPSLSVSEGLAEAGRDDMRSGGKDTKQFLTDLVENIDRSIDIYHPFIEALSKKIAFAVQEAIRWSLINFRDTDNQMSINDLQDSLEQNVKSSFVNMNTWTVLCYQQAFEGNAGKIQQKLSSILSNYSQTKDFQLRKDQPQLNPSIELDLTFISAEMKRISGNFIDEPMSEVMKNVVAGIGGGIVAGIGGGIVGSIVGGIVGGIAGGLLSIILLGPFFIATILTESFYIATILTGPFYILVIGFLIFDRKLFGHSMTDEEKKKQALSKALDKYKRRIVYDEFMKEWNKVCQTINTSVDEEIRNNQALKKTVDIQSKKTLLELAEICIREARLKLE